MSDVEDPFADLFGPPPKEVPAPVVPPMGAAKGDAADDGETTKAQPLLPGQPLQAHQYVMLKEDARDYVHEAVAESVEAAVSVAMDKLVQGMRSFITGISKRMESLEREVEDMKGAVVKLDVESVHATMNSRFSAVDGSLKEIARSVQAMRDHADLVETQQKLASLQASSRDPAERCKGCNGDVDASSSQPAASPSAHSNVASPPAVALQTAPAAPAAPVAATPAPAPAAVEAVPVTAQGVPASMPQPHAPPPPAAPQAPHAPSQSQASPGAPPPPSMYSQPPSHTRQEPATGPNAFTFGPVGPYRAPSGVLHSGVQGYGEARSSGSNAVFGSAPAAGPTVYPPAPPAPPPAPPRAPQAPPPPPSGQHPAMYGYGAGPGRGHDGPGAFASSGGGGGGGGTFGYSSHSSGSGQVHRAPPMPRPLESTTQARSTQQVISDICQMGFRRDQVESVLQRMVQQGKGVDLNAVVDTLMSDSR